MRSSHDSKRYGLIVDVGSGSIGFSIVESDPKKKQAETLWQKRERVKMTHIETIADSSKALISTLTDMALVLSSEGLTTLQKHTNSSKTSFSSMQVFVAAPWSYTVSRTITYEQDSDFEITDELVHDLAVAAGEDAMHTFKEKYNSITQEITETTHCILDTYANGYRLPSINNQTTKSLELKHATTLVYSTLYNALVELNDKLFSGVPLHVTSSMLGFYYATRQVQPHIFDVCLIDITNEATEIGIVRDGALMYCTHTPFGSAAIAREVAAALNRPLSEVHGRLNDLLGEKNEDITKILNGYEAKIAELLTETGDSLAIPSTIYILGDQNSTQRLHTTIKRAAEQACKTSTTVTTTTKVLSNKVDGDQATDEALLIAKRFFHTTPNRLHFEYL